MNRRATSLLLRTAGVCLLAVFLAACGKKGPPTLKSFEKPDAPSSLSAVHREGTLILRWHYARTGEAAIAEFIVLRSTGAGFEKLSHIAKDKRTFIDRDIKTGGTYRYKVIAQNFRGVYSDDSPVVEAAPAEVPLPPRDLSYTVKDNFIALSWAPADQGARYNVYKTVDKGQYGLTPANQTPLSEPLFRDSLSINRIVYYTVRSLTESEIRDEGAASEELAVDPADLVPPRPENVQAYPSPDRIVLSWSEVSEPWVTGYRVYRKTSGNNYILIGSTQIPTFVDIDDAAVGRDYRVTAVGPAKEGPATEISNVVYTPQR
jgi:predicted small lipoprotein YifL